MNAFCSSKSEGFNLKDTEVLVDSKDQSLFKELYIGKPLGLVCICRSTAKLADRDQKSRFFLQGEGGAILLNHFFKVSLSFGGERPKKVGPCPNPKIPVIESTITEMVVERAVSFDTVVMSYSRNKVLICSVQWSVERSFRSCDSILLFTQFFSRLA